MWKAEKIELTKNAEDAYYKTAFYLADCKTLKINGELICDAIEDRLPLSTFDSFETCICTYCGQEGCNGSPELMIRKYSGGLLFLPEFDCMDSFEQYNYTTCEGNRCCPPQKWYDDGILIVDKERTEELLRILPELRIETIPELSKKEWYLILKWERAVIQKPEKFLSNENN